MNRERKMLEEIELRKTEIRMLEEQIINLRYLDLKEMEGKYYLVDGYTKDARYVHHIILIEKEKMVFEYGDLDAKYIARSEYSFLIQLGYKKWTEITKKQYLSKIKGFEDLRGEK